MKRFIALASLLVLLGIGFTGPNNAMAINAAASLGSSYIGRTVPNIAKLRTIKGGLGVSQNISVQPLGYTTVGDGGGGPVRTWLLAPSGGKVDDGAGVIIPGGAIDDNATEGTGYWGWGDLTDVRISWYNVDDFAMFLHATGSDNVTLEIDNLITLSDNATVATNITLKKVIPTTAFTGAYNLDINGGMTGDMWSQWFDPTVTVAGEPKVEYFTAEMMGGGTDKADNVTFFQRAVSSVGAGKVLVGIGTYIVGDSGSTVAYRATTTKAGISLPSGVQLVGLGQGSIIKTKDSSFCVPIVADGVNSVGVDNLQVKGNSANNQSGLPFGVYYHDVTDSSIPKLWVDDSYDNSIEVIGGSNNVIGDIYCTSSGPSSIGGGLQVEDSSQLLVGSVSGSTFDDLVSVIAHGDNSQDISFPNINGTSEAARVLFLGQSSSATGTRTISNVTAHVVSRSCVLSPAVKIFRNGVYKNINITQVDRGSINAFSLQPWETTGSGEIYSSTFDIQSYDALGRAIEVRHNDLAATIIKNNSLKAVVINPNTADTSAKEAIVVESGDFWSLDVNVDYTTGRTNPAVGAVSVGGSNTNDIVRYSRLDGSISGGDTNLRINNSLDLNLDNLVLQDSENTNTSLDITALASDTKIGIITRDKEILDSGTGTQRQPIKMYSSITQATTGGAIIETDLISYTVPGRFMGLSGIMHVKANGTISGANGTKVIKFHIGGSNLTLQVATNNTGDWHADIYIYENVARAAQKFDVQYSVNGGTQLVDYITKGVSTSSDFIIKFTGTTANASDSITQETMFVEGM